jgi:hypothetical protein
MAISGKGQAGGAISWIGVGRMAFSFLNRGPTGTHDPTIRDGGRDSMKRRITKQEPCRPERASANS